MAYDDVGAIMLSLLRVICLFAFSASIAVLAMDYPFTNNIQCKKKKTTTIFKDIIPVRYLLWTAIMWVANSLIRNEFFQQLDFFGDKVLSFILASVGLAYCFQLKGLLEHLLATIRSSEAVLPDKLGYILLLDHANVTAGLLLAGFTCMAIASIYTFIARRRLV